jgi:gliding motility-associated protein GldC
MPKSSININVTLDEQKMPEQISWNASETSAEDDRDAKAMFLSFWDGNDRAALRIDLWTKSMMVDEMADFFYQTFMGMADTYQRATRNQEVTQEIKQFAENFYKKFQDQQLTAQGK